MAGKCECRASQPYFLVTGYMGAQKNRLRKQCEYVLSKARSLGFLTRWLNAKGRTRKGLQASPEYFYVRNILKGKTLPNTNYRYVFPAFPYARFMLALQTRGKAGTKTNSRKLNGCVSNSYSNFYLQIERGALPRSIREGIVLSHLFHNPVARGLQGWLCIYKYHLDGLFERIIKPVNGATRYKHSVAFCHLHLSFTESAHPFSR